MGIFFDDDSSEEKTSSNNTESTYLGEANQALADSLRKEIEKNSNNGIIIPSSTNNKK